MNELNEKHNNELNGKHNRRKCDECNRHALLERDISNFLVWTKDHSIYSENVQKKIGERVKTSQFRYVSSGLGVLLVLILGFVISLYAQSGNMRVDLTEKIATMTSDQKVSIAAERATLGSMKDQVNHIANIQVTVTRFIGDQVNIRRDIDRLMNSVEHLEKQSLKPSINVYPGKRGGNSDDPTR